MSYLDNQYTNVSSLVRFEIVALSAWRKFSDEVLFNHRLARVKSEEWGRIWDEIGIVASEALSD